jgi:hypothetical protein
MLVLATQPFHRLLQGPGVPNLDLLRADPYLHRFADQPRRHRVGVVLDPDRAAAAHLHPLPLRRFQPLCRQRPQTGQLRGQPLLPAGIAAGHQFLDEPPILRSAGKVATAPQQQRLLQRLLEPVVRLLAVAILMAAGRVGRFRFQAVMAQKRPILGRVLLELTLVMHRQRHAVGAMPRRHTAQRGQRVLQPLTQAGKTLRGAHRHVLPVRVRQDKMVDQVRERLARDGHAQRLHVREIGSAQPTRLMHLSEEDFLGRPVLGLPLPHPPLERPLDLGPRLLRKFPLQPFS